MVAGFLLAILPLIATPGASLALLMVRGPRRALPVVAGTVTGIYTHALLAMVGLAAVVMQSSQAFLVVRVAGAVYLVGLGLWTWRAPRPASSLGSPTGPERPAFRQAYLGNVLNPKAASIYLTLVPQFVDPRHALAPQILVLATAHAVLITAWLGGWTAVLARVGRMIRSGRWASGIRRSAAAVLVFLGVRTLAA
ncbi:threonine/homoserine/homoserine lactone efflux protein [Hamadaea flava]|uniref:LysE family translocator n=1 Tax=Hamadaea flava TaxID=1742688 RepID=A0ABV8M278_9ACTN|nr:LysE family translocator [Hamadaea flava]MCP2324482.1 threonine/homoserine/homoserine lactone efflux protein [Hamadaea flava]